MVKIESLRLLCTMYIVHNKMCSLLCHLHIHLTYLSMSGHLWFFNYLAKLAELQRYFSHWVILQYWGDPISIHMHLLSFIHHYIQKLAYRLRIYIIWTLPLSPFFGDFLDKFWRNSPVFSILINLERLRGKSIQF